MPDTVRDPRSSQIRGGVLGNRASNERKIEKNEEAGVAHRKVAPGTGAFVAERRATETDVP